jgi:hypothetical protein
MVFVCSFHFKVLIKIKGIPFLGTSCPWLEPWRSADDEDARGMYVHIWSLLGASPFPYSAGESRRHSRAHCAVRRRRRGSSYHHSAENEGHVVEVGIV